MAATRSRRDALVRIIGSAMSIHVAGTAGTFAFLRSLMDEVTADVAVVEIDSTPDSGVAREWITEFLDRLPVVLLAEGRHPDLFNAILRAEGAGLLRSDASADQIGQAIQAVRAGLVTFDSTLVAQNEPASDLDEELTPRETQVLALLSEGLGNREIAARLRISEHTIKFHIRSILGKLGASTRTEAVSRGLRHGLIEL